jgi:Phage integrase, N-terminal SAM-like domain
VAVGFSRRKKDARKELNTQLAQVNDVGYRPRPTASFTVFAAKWEREVLKQFRESTAINYRTHMRRHLVPFFGPYGMKDITPELV